MCATVFCNPFDAGCGIHWEAWSAIGTILSALLAGVAAFLAVRIARQGNETAAKLRLEDQRAEDERAASERKNYAAMLAVAVGRLADAAELMLSIEQRIRAQTGHPTAFIHQGRLLLKEIAFVRLFRPYTELRNDVLLSAVAEVEHVAADFENGLGELIRLDDENERARAAHYARPYAERAGDPDWHVQIHPGDSWKDVRALPDVCNRAVKALLAAD